MIYFNFNGKIYPEGSPVIGADNRGLRYGDGLFETMKLKAGKILFEDEHFSRLWKGLKLTEFDLPKHFTVELLQKEIYSLAKKNLHDNAARIRLNIVRGNGGLHDAKNHHPSYIIQTWALAKGMGEWNSNGLVLGIYDRVHKSCDLLSNVKHNNFLPYVMAAIHAKKEKWNDAILLNTHGRLCDATIANLFIVKDGVFYTPPLSEGCIAGVMRKRMLKYLADEKWEAVEKELETGHLFTADEVFLTNSIFTIRWVQRIGDCTYQNMLTQKILAGFNQTNS